MDYKMKAERKKIENVTWVFPAIKWILTVLLLVITVCGVSSFVLWKISAQGTTAEFINQYGDCIKMWGVGIYAHDSNFKAPIFIGTDVTILLLVVPMMFLSITRLTKKRSAEHYINSIAVLGVLLYYAASIAFGITYNQLHLLYIALFGVCFFSVAILYTELHGMSIHQEKLCTYSITKGMRVFLFLSGFSLFVAWLPDILTSVVNGTSLGLIEVYTTEVTYVLDMGIISPLLFLTLYLVRRGSFIGYVLFRMLLRLCMVIGVILPMQTVFQVIAGIEMPIPALITKMFIFLIMAVFATYFEYGLKRKTTYLGEKK